jgi:hypothetical protein
VRTHTQARKDAHLSVVGLSFSSRSFVCSRSRSGLDSFQADRVVDALAALAHGDGGACVLAALHAPRSASFARLDDLLLLVRLFPLICAHPSHARDVA